MKGISPTQGREDDVVVSSDSEILRLVTENICFKLPGQHCG